MRIGMIGGRTSTLGFRGLGVDTFAVATPEDAPQAFKEIEIDQYGLLFVTEPVYEVLKRAGDILPEKGTPIVAVIPAVKGSVGIGRAEIKEMVERAAGTSMFIGD